ncbi:CD166 antigen homolog [Ptychodera flava]|uniref:CD166 antigen homolog n=1 Tax=Ptychodera flava TaxID=63121 RepID=UPI00396A6E94
MKAVLLIALVATISLRTSVAVTITDPDLRVEEGDDVVIVCQSTNSNPTIEWKYNDDDLPSDERFNVTSSESGSTLTIFNVTRADEGIYTCKESNSQFDAQLTVYTIPIVKVTSVPLSRQITVGENRTLTCETNAYEERIEWTKNGRDVSQMTNIVVEDDTLTIINTQWTDAGVYECSINITDIAKQDIVRSDLYDLVAPVNIILTKNVKLEEGETARIGCNATGYPSPT